MTQHLIFQLYSPFVSWGEPAVGEKRHSHIIPSRSALLGMVAAALGIRRDDEACDEFYQHYHLAVRPFITKSSWLSDYHTLQVPKEEKGKHYHTRYDEINQDKLKLQTLLSQREYYNDAYFQVVLSATDQAPYSLEAIHQALLTPRFSLYAGRKNSPLGLPLAPLLHTGTLASAFKYADEQYRHYHEQDPVISLLLQEKADEYYWDHPNQAHEFNITKTQQRQDQPINRKRWQFRKRQQYSGCLKKE